MKAALNRLAPFVLIGPALLIVGFGLFYPTLLAVRIGFFDWQLGTDFADAAYVGVSEFARALGDPAVQASLWRTILFAATVVSVEMVLGTALALLLEKPVRGMSVFRTVFILPMMVAPIVVGFIWRYLLDTQFGPVNAALGALGLEPRLWLADPTLAFLAIVVSDIWQWTPFVMIMVLAGLQNLDQSALEASRIDGATPLQTILLVKLPMLAPVLMVTLLLRLIDAFRVLEVIYVLTFGGPGTATEILPLTIYKTAFISQELGYASAIAVVLLAVVFLLSTLAVSLSNPMKASR